MKKNFKKIFGLTGEDGVDDAHAQRDPQALLHAVELARAEVLPHEGLL